ncbi:hypothetical protein AEAC466_07900 [Asticcacaulis sp. AC466]|uniref:pirin family protein n=1 Tax=Asticcacaulis sp. AC466 TaxID=1282362 RepID=UPI0003C3AFE8|nr:pirin family protein [Asticcacaulis sp. AC466]ESQ84274.1 hypothetical protein AEAC466_07900 [Asticcacaulis sp. AC466]
MFMQSQPQQYRAARVVRIVRAIPANAGAGVTLNRVIGSDGLPVLDPFLTFDELRAENPLAAMPGFPDQAHRGFETITYMVRGRLHYSDNKGNTALINAGELQWLTSGSGLVNSEMPEQVDGEIQGFQIALNLPAAAKMQPSVYRSFAADDVPAVIFKTAEVRVLAGRYHGLIGPITSPVTDPFIVDILLKPEGDATLPLPDGYQSFVYVVDGTVAIGQSLVSRGQAAILDAGNVLKLAAGQGDARVLVVSGRPLNEPVVRHGLFVMNSTQDIKQAFTDYQNGLF